MAEDKTPTKSEEHPAAYVGGEPGTDWAGPSRKEIEEGVPELRGTEGYTGPVLPGSPNLGNVPDSPGTAPSNDLPAGGTVGIGGARTEEGRRVYSGGDTGGTVTQQEPFGGSDDSADRK